MIPTRARSILKAFTWRLLASLDTFFLGFLITGRPVAAASIAGGEVLTKMALYYLHERGWAAVDWGHRPARLAHLSHNGEAHGFADPHTLPGIVRTVRAARLLH